jgi:hypothetical protein
MLDYNEWILVWIAWIAIFGVILSGLVVTIVYL